MEPTPISYPVLLETSAPARFARMQLLLRILLLAGIGILHQTLFGIFGALYLVLPVVAVIAISRNGGAGYGRSDARVLIGVLEWVVGFYAYLLFVTDRFPLRAEDRAVRLSIEVTGAPRVGGALARLLTTLPHAVVLGVLGIAAAVGAFVGALMVLVTESCPEGLRTFQRDIVAWIARVLAYHASLVEAYPPFSLTTDHPSTAHG